MITFRMSSTGYCARRLSAMLLGKEGGESPRWLQESANEGNWHEARLKQELTALGCQVIDEQRELRMPLDGCEAVGHIDGRVAMTPAFYSSPLFTHHYIDCSPADLDSAFHCLEVKTFSFLEHQRWISEGFDGYFRSYAFQHTMYRQALGEKLSFLTTKDRSGGARNLYIIGKDLVEMGEIKEKLAKVVQYVEQGDLVPIDFDSQSLECRRCQYRTSQCLSKLPQVDDAEVMIAAQDYFSGRQQEKEGKLLADQSKELLVAYAKRKQLRRWSTGEFVVSYSSFPREDVSIRRLLEVMPREQFEEAVSVSQVDRITVVNSNKEED